MGRRTLPCRMGHREPGCLCSQVTSGCRAGQEGQFSQHNLTGLLLPPRIVLELGSGAGLTGLAICKTCCPSTYIFSDCYTCVLEQLRGNILLNGLSLEPDTTDPARHPGHNAYNSESPRVMVAHLDWDVVTTPELAAFQPDVIIAAGTASCPAATGTALPSAQLWEGDSVYPARQRNDETCRSATVGLQGDIKLQGMAHGCPKATVLPLDTVVTCIPVKMVPSDK